MDHWVSQGVNFTKQPHRKEIIPSAPYPKQQTHSNGREGVLKSYTVVTATWTRASCPHCVETQKHLKVTKFQNPTRLFLGCLFILSNGTHLIEDLALPLHSASASMLPSVLALPLGSLRSQPSQCWHAYDTSFRSYSLVKSWGPKGKGTGLIDFISYCRAQVMVDTFIFCWIGLSWS